MARILVVDDEELVRTALQKMLKRAGHDVVVVSDGKTGLQSYRDAPADFVFTDVFMPDMDGVEFINKLLSEFPDAKIGVVSGGGGRADPRSLLPLMSRMRGVVGTIEKPFTHDELLRLLGQALDPAAAED